MNNATEDNRMPDSPDGTGLLRSGRESAGFYAMQAFGVYSSEDVRGGGCSSTLKQRDYKDATDIVVQEGVRRVMPIECCRLQGFPDIWDSVPGSDSAKYRMYGNGMALPCVLYVMEGIVEFAKEKD